MDDELRDAVLKVAGELHTELSLLEKCGKETNEAFHKRNGGRKALAEFYMAQAMEGTVRAQVGYSFLLLVQEAKEVPNA